MNTANQSTLSAGLNELLNDPGQKGYFARRNAMDWFFAAVMLGAMVIAFSLYHGAMDGYEKGILLGITPAAIALGWFWRPLARLMLGTGALAMLAIWLYQGENGAGWQPTSGHWWQRSGCRQCRF